MKDGIIKGSGNSRYLKSVANALTLYPTHEALMNALAAGNFPIDLNGQNPGGWNNAGTPLNKASLLKDATAAMFGLDANAVPDDVLAWLGKYNQYWWQRYPIVKGAGTVRQIARKLSADTSAMTIRYSTEFYMDSFGSFVLKNPSELSFTVNSGTSVFSVLTNKYIDTPMGSSNLLYGYCYGGVSQITENSSTEYRANVGYVSLGAPDIIHSSNPMAYPGGLQGDYFYEPVGKPFEIMPYMSRVSTFFYTGTGTFGEADPNVLTFPFEPKLVIVTDGTLTPTTVSTASGGYRGTWRGGFLWTKGMTSTTAALTRTPSQGSSSAVPIQFELSGNSLEFYCTYGDEPQMNMDKTRYYVTAIG